MRLYILPITVTALILCGCSSTRSSRGKTTIQQEPAKTPQEEVLTYDHAAAEPLFEYNEPAAKDEATVQCPVITFNSMECANVRYSPAYNPFPASGELEVALTSLQKDFCYPYRGKLISPYGPRGKSTHSGIDIKAIPNDTIRAAWPGVVRMSKVYGGYGNLVVIRHYNGLETAYAHNSKNLVNVNDVVEAGTPVGLAGRTGRATTEHMHFEVRVACEHLDPQLFVDPYSFTLKNDTLFIRRSGGKITASKKQKQADENTESLAQTTIETPEPTHVQAVSNTNNNAVYHTICSGDTLWSLSRRYGTTVAAICELNSIKPQTTLKLNRKLRVK